MTNALTAFGERGMHGDRWGFHPVMAVLCVLLIGAVGALVVWAFRSRGTTPAVPVVAPPAPPSPTAHAEAILAERLARGEVTPEDYRTTLEALRGSGTSA